MENTHTFKFWHLALSFVLGIIVTIGVTSTVNTEDLQGRFSATTSCATSEDIDDLFVLIDENLYHKGDGDSRMTNMYEDLTEELDNLQFYVDEQLYHKGSGDLRMTNMYNDLVNTIESSCT